MIRTERRDALKDWLAWNLHVPIAREDRGGGASVGSSR